MTNPIARVDEARLVEICISPGHDYWTRGGQGRMTHGIRSVLEVECVAGRGLRGDRYFERPHGHKGQVTLMEQSVVEEIRARFKLPKLPASIFRRNLIVSGMKLSELYHQEFEFQGVRFFGSQECTPCHWMDRVVAEGVQDFMAESFRGGLRVRVLSDGCLKVDGSDD